MAFHIVRNDITKMNTEAIVNTANAHVTVGPGCDSAVYKAAGYEELLNFRKEHIGFVEEGGAFLTPGFQLQAKYIIHAVSPLFICGEQEEKRKLRSCYQKSLQLAKENGIKSVAFPLISTGGFGYPKEEGMRIAVDEINTFLLKNDMDIFLVVFDEKATQLGERIFPELEEFIDQNYVKTRQKEEYGSEFISVDRSSRSEKNHGFPHQNALRRIFRSEENANPDKLKEGSAPDKQHGKRKKDFEYKFAKRCDVPAQLCEYSASKAYAEPEEKSENSEFEGYEDDLEEICEYMDSQECNTAEKICEYPNAEECGILEKASDWDDEDKLEELNRKLNERLAHRSDTFSEYLLYLIASKGMKNSDVYNRAIVDKRYFSKIKNNKDFHPEKLKALCLCVGAKLELDETKDLLARAGYALSPSDLTDIIFSFYIEHKHFDVIDIDIQLEEHGLPCIIS